MGGIIEFLKHALGLCGEPHPSLLTLLGGAPVLGYLIYKIKSYGILHRDRKGPRRKRKR